MCASQVLQSFGLNAMLIQRTHYAIKRAFAKQSNLEFYW